MTESGERQSETRARLVSRECAGCGKRIFYGGVGRPPRYCSPACRQRVWALRAAEKRLGTPADPRPAVVREVVERVVERTARSAAPVIPSSSPPAAPETARNWVVLLDQLAAQLGDPTTVIAREHWHHRRVYTALVQVVASLGQAHPGGLNALHQRR